MKNIEERIAEIEKRNHKVELNKAWEVSWTRRISIATVTYILAVLLMWSIKVPYPYFNALVPTGGFILSTLTLGLFKKTWIKRHETKKKLQK